MNICQTHVFLMFAGSAILFLLFVIIVLLREQEKNKYIIELSKKIDDFVNIHKISFVLADEVKKLLGAEFVCVVEYTYSKTEILSALPAKPIDKSLFSPHEIFYILKSLQKEKAATINEHDIQSEHLKQYFPLFNYNAYKIITIYNDEFRIITLEIYGEEKITIKLRKNILEKIIEIYQKAFLSRITLLKDILKVKMNETIIKFLDRIRNTLEEDELEKIILEEITQSFNADRAFYIKSFTSNPQNPRIGKEYLANPYVKSLIGNNLDYEAVWEQLKETQANPPVFVIENSEKFIKQNKLDGTPIEKFIRDSQTKSSYPFLIYQDDKLSMYIVLQFTRNIVVFDKNDFEIMELLTKQTHIALMQAKLYTKLILNSKEEKLIIDLINTLRSSLSLEDVANEFTSKVGMFFGAKRCVIRFYDNKRKEFKGYNEAFEYKKDYTVKSTKDSNLQKELGDFLLNAEKFHDTISIEYTKDLCSDDFEYKNDIINYFDKYELKSFLLGFIRYNGKILGFISLHFEDENIIKKEDLKLIKTLSDQLGIAIYQSELYYDIQNIAKKEKFLKEIYADTIGLIDKEQIFKYFSEKLMSLLNASGIVFGEFENEENIPIKYYEYYHRENRKISKFKEYAFINEIISKKDFFYICNLINSDVDSKQSFAQESNVTCLATVPINNTLTMIIFFDKKREFSAFEKNILHSLIEVISNTLKETLQKAEINTMRETFLSTLSHDLQIPIIAQRNAIEYLRKKECFEDENSSEILKYLQETNEQSEEMLKVLSAIYRYESKKKILHKKNCDLNIIVKSVTEKLQTKINEKNITFSIEPEESNPLIWADENEIEKIIVIFFMQLTENNLNRDISVKINQTGNTIRLCMYSDGKNSQESLSAIMLNRDIITANIERKVGEGIHLYLAKLIAIAHEGKIYINEKYTDGTVFCLELPKL